MILEPTPLGALILAVFLVPLAVIDLRTGYLPNIGTGPLTLIGLGAAFLQSYDAFLAAVIGQAAGYAALSLLNMAYRWHKGRDGIGMGDAKLLGAGGAWVGWQGLPVVLLIASLGTLATVLVLSRLRGQPIDGSLALPFGPGIAAGIFAVYVAPLLMLT